MSGFGISPVMLTGSLNYHTIPSGLLKWPRCTIHFAFVEAKKCQPQEDVSLMIDDQGYHHHHHHHHHAPMPISGFGNYILGITLKIPSNVILGHTWTWEISWGFRFRSSFFVFYRHVFFRTMDKDRSVAVRFTNFSVPSDCFPESHGIPESRNQPNNMHVSPNRGGPWQVLSKRITRVGGSSIFYVHPYLGKIPIKFWLIFFKGVLTTN